MPSAKRPLAPPDIALPIAAATLAFAFFRVTVRPMPLWRLTLPTASGHEQLADLLGMDAHGALRFALFTLATLGIYGASLRLSRDAESRWVFVAAPCAFAIVVGAAAPTASRDVYHYLAEGRLLSRYGMNPLVTPPAAVDGASDAVIDAAVDWRHTPARYGTLHVALMAAATAIGGGDVAVSLGVVRLFGCLAYLGATLAVARLAAPGLRAQASVAFGWNPLVLFEGVANLHNDLVMAALALAALLATVRRSYVIAAALFVASSLVKFATAPVAVLALAYALGSDPGARRRLVTIGAVAMTVGAALYVPFVVTVGGAWSTASVRELLLSLLPPPDGLLRPQLAVAGVVLVTALGRRLLRAPTLDLLLQGGAAATAFGLYAFSPTVWPWYAITVLALGAVATDRPPRPWLLILTSAFLTTELVVIWRWVFGAPNWNSRPYNLVTGMVMYAPLFIAFVVAAIRGACGGRRATGGRGSQPC